MKDRHKNAGHLDVQLPMQETHAGADDAKFTKLLEKRGKGMRLEYICLCSLLHDTHSQQIQHGHRVQQTASLEVRASQSAAWHFADGCLDCVVEFVQQLMHMLDASRLQFFQAHLMIKVNKIIGEERFIAGVEKEVDRIGQNLRKMNVH